MSLTARLLEGAPSLCTVNRFDVAAANKAVNSPCPVLKKTDTPARLPRDLLNAKYVAYQDVLERAGASVMPLVSALVPTWVGKNRDLL
jgi:hypothetical protein